MGKVKIMRVTNPIIRGFYPDPSVCKANGKYYMVCSSFEYFPGVPLFESEDLINWKQIGHCLTRKTQVDLHEIDSSGGVFAPTIRYNNGRFYMVTTNDTYHKNFYVYTDNIYGEWSEPVFVEQDGIDPSLFFEDGKTYFMSNGSDPADNNGCIFQCEIDAATGKKLTESKPVWKGSGGRYLESPHLYHFGEWYYIMAAEGGTEYGHMVTYARAKSPYGPFEQYPSNPVLTNRNLGGHQSTIQGIGHGDLVQDDQGNTFMFCLGFRHTGMWQPFHHLGREVFIVPVHWNEDGWFTAGVDGIVCKEMELDIDANPCNCDGKYNVSLDKMDALSLRWCHLREYKEENYKFADGCLSLRGAKAGLSDASFRVVSTNEDYSFYAKCGGEEVFMGKAGTKYLSSEVAGGFTGTVMAMYAVNKNGNEDKWAVFSRLDWEQGI